MGLDKTKVKHSFAAAVDTYDSAAQLQRDVGEALLAKFPMQARPGWLLDLGCGTGFLTRQMRSDVPGISYLALDIALPMLQAARRRNTFPVGYVCADAEQLPFAKNSVQQLYSNLALQWCEDLPAVFSDASRLLQTDGQLVFSTFGPNTLRELKRAWASVDDFAHVNDFYSADQIVVFLKMAGFSTVSIETACYQLRYPSVVALMQELKQLGAHNVNQTRNRRLTTRSELQRMIACYENAILGGEIVASYEIVYSRATL